MSRRSDEPLTPPQHRVNLANMRGICARRQGVRATERGALLPLFMALVLPFWIGLFGDVALADVARPPGTGTGPVVGKVHLLGGTTSQIRASGKSFSASIGLPLLASDELIVPVGEFLVVALSNGHLVRIDEDLTMKVSEIVLLGVPPTQESLVAQLDRLLTKKERAQSERISGVQARRQGGDEIPVETNDRQQIKPKVSTRATPVLLDPIPDAGREAKPRAEPVAPSPPAPPAPTVQPMPPRTGTPAPTTPKPPTIGALDDGVRKQSPGLTLPKQNETKQCLVGALLPSISRVNVEVKLKGGRIVRVRLRGGLVAPACMSKLLLKQPGQGPDDQWLSSEIVLR